MSRRCSSSSSSSSEESSEEEGAAVPVSQELLLDELSADTLAALQNHLQREEESSDSDEEQDGGAGVSENFGLSQFWYDGDTATRLAEEAIEHAKGGTIAILSAPSAFKALREIEPDRNRAYIFEYDPRFSNFGSSFVKYDFNSPELVPDHLKGACDYIMADPPYLNPDAVAKFARTIRLLARQPAGASAAEPEPEPEPDPSNSRSEETDRPAAVPVPVPVLYLSGAVTREWVADELGLRPNNFRPTFSSKLSNEFYCYTNYTSTRLGGFETDD